MLQNEPTKGFLYIVNRSSSRFGLIMFAINIFIIVD